MDKAKEKKKHHFKMPTAFTILFLIIIIMAILSWIFQQENIK